MVSPDKISSTQRKKEATRKKTETRFLA